jgi:cytochrome c556
MSWRRVRKALLGIVAAGVMATPGLGIADDEAIEKSMRNALEGLQPLLIGLVNADHEAVLRDIEPILQHAAQLTETIPDSAKKNQDEFLTWAYYLKVNGDILKSTVNMIVQNEKAGEAAIPDFLPVVAASHYGGIVNTCVACHTHFRFPIEE